MFCLVAKAFRAIDTPPATEDDDRLFRRFRAWRQKQAKAQ